MRTLTLAGALAAVLLAAGCSETHESSAPVPHNAIADTTKTGVLRMPDGFRNVAYGCHGPNLVYVTSRSDDGSAISSSVAVSPNDPYCTGAGPAPSTTPTGSP